MTGADPGISSFNTLELFGNPPLSSLSVCGLGHYLSHSSPALNRPSPPLTYNFFYI